MGMDFENKPVFRSVVVHKKSDCHIIILRKLMGRVSTQGYLKPPTFQTYAINMQDAMNIHEF